MRITLDGNGFSFSIRWNSMRSALKHLLPLITAVGAFLAAPEVKHIIELLSQ
jgi:hypothetical protein